MMAKVNTFFCNCGRTIGRPANFAPGVKDAPIYNVVPWHARPGDGVLRGIRCGTCGQWWTFKEPKKWTEFVDVSKSCEPLTCSTIDHLNGRCE